jgi:hypothetical protein
MTRPYPPPIPESLIALHMIRSPASGAVPCDICGHLSGWVIRTTHVDGDRVGEFVTHLCTDHAGGFLEGLTDRIGAADA